MSDSTIGVPNNPAHSLEDIQNLLFLESVRRFRDNESNIKRQVEEKTRQYLAAKNEYLQLYSQYVDLVTASLTLSAPDELQQIEVSKLAAAKEDINSIKEKLTTGNVTAELSANAVAECKEKLAGAKSHEKLQQLQLELMEDKSSVKAIKTAIEAVEATIETATLQGLDFFVGEVQVTDS